MKGGWFRIILVLTIIDVAFGGLGYLLLGLPAAVTVAGALALLQLFMYAYGERILLRWYRVRTVTEVDYPHLYEALARISSAAGIPVPRLALAPIGTPNAFSLGKSPHRSMVVLTYGLLRVLDMDEVEGVMAHEVSHLTTGETSLQTTSSVFAGLLLEVAYGLKRIANRILGKKEEDPNGGIFFRILAPISGGFIRFVLSPSREYRADESAAFLSGKPLALASALLKIEKAIKFRPMKGGNLATAPIFIVHPFRGEIAERFSTHPPAEKRAERLLQIAEEKGMYS